MARDGRRAGWTWEIGMARDGTHDGEFRRGWPVLVAALLGTMFGASPLPYNSIGSLMQPLMAQFAVGPDRIGMTMAIYGLTGCVIAPLIGALADRIGTRPVALVSLVAFGLCFGAIGSAASLGGLYLGYFLMGLIGIGTTPVIWSRLVATWFVANRGLALGLVLVGTGLAAFILPMLTVALIDRFGWRLTYPLLALLPLTIALPAAIAFVRDPPASADAATARIVRSGLTLRAAIATRRFWIMFVAFLAVALAYGGFHVNLQNMMRLAGYGDRAGAMIAGVLGLTIIVGRVGAGYLFDRFWAPLVALPLLCLPGIACLMFAHGMPSLPAIIAGVVALGLASGAETDLIAYLAGRYFGMAYYGRIYGLLYAAFGMGSALSPLLYGYSFAHWGGYGPALRLAALLFGAGGGLLLALGRYPAAFGPPAAPAPA